MDYLNELWEKSGCPIKSENGGFHFEVNKRKFDPHFNFSLDNPDGHYNVTLKGTVKETKDKDRPFHLSV